MGASWRPLRTLFPAFPGGQLSCGRRAGSGARRWGSPPQLGTRCSLAAAGPFARQPVRGACRDASPSTPGCMPCTPASVPTSCSRAGCPESLGNQGGNAVTLSPLACLSGVYDALPAGAFLSGNPLPFGGLLRGSVLAGLSCFCSGRGVLLTAEAGACLPCDSDARAPASCRAQLLSQ